MAKGPRPILGFGLAGWIALAALLAIIIAWGSGADLQYHFLRLVNAVVGPTGVYAFVIWFMAYQWTALFTAQYGIGAVLYTLVALHVSSRRIEWWWYTAVIAWGLSAPTLRGWIDRPVAGGAAILGGGPWVTEVVVGTTGVGIAGVTAFVLYAATRSRLVGLVAAGGVLGTSIFAGLWWVSLMVWPTLGTWWHVALAGALLWWAIDERLHPPSATLCPKCGYDLRGANHEKCPECGAGVASDKSTGGVTIPAVSS